MNFYLPTKIYFGDDVLHTHGVEISDYGKHALLVTGKHSAHKSNVIRDLLPLLNDLGVKYTIFDQVTENPDLTIIEKGKKFFLSQNCDFVIAVGGGSPLDAGKAISLIAGSNLCRENIYNTQLHTKAFPIIAIPTTSGSGSEVTQYSVLNDNECKKKAGMGSSLLFPKISFLDPAYTLSLNKTITRDTSIDALSHLLEGLYSNKYNEYLLPIIYKGIKLIYENLAPCLENLDNIDYRRNLMLASNYGGVTIAHTSTTLQHSIGYPLTTVYGLSHGLANGVVMKSIMNLYEPYISDRLHKLFNDLKIEKNDFFTWLDSFDMKFEHQIKEDFINSRVPEVMQSRNMALNPYSVKEKDIIKIYYDITNK